MANARGNGNIGQACAAPLVEPGHLSCRCSGGNPSAAGERLPLSPSCRRGGPAAQQVDLVIEQGGDLPKQLPLQLRGDVEQPVHRPAARMSTSTG